MPSPTYAQVSYPEYLRDLVVDYRVKGFIANDIMPPLKVRKKEGVYYTFSRAEALTIPLTHRPPDAVAREDTWSTETVAYACQDHARRKFLNQQVIDDADDVIQIEMRSTKKLANKILLAHEQRVANMVFSAGNYAGANKTQLTGTNKFSDYTNSDPFSVIDTGRNACAETPNVMIMGAQVFDKLKYHPALKELIKGGATTQQPALVLQQTMAELFEFEKVVVGRVQYNTAAKKTTATYGYLWGKHIVLAYVNDAAAIDDVTFANYLKYSPKVENAVGASEGIAEGYRVREYPDVERGGGGKWIETEMFGIETLVSADCAYFIQDAVA